LPLSVASEPIIVLHVHVSEHPLPALTVAVVPGAEASSFLGPDIHHLARLVDWI